jgi:hypothetical protein
MEHAQYFIILPEKKQDGVFFYFADRWTTVSLCISPAVHESAFVDLSVGGGEECPLKDRYCWQDIIALFVDPGAHLLWLFLQLASIER